MAKEMVEQDDYEMDMMPMVMMIVMTVVMLAAMSQIIVPLAQAQTQVLQAQVYEGVEDPRTIRSTNMLSWINLVQDYPFTPWISAYFINDGPSSVEVGINYPSDTFTIKQDETVTITRSGAQERIKIIFFKCSPGLKATLRVTGTF